MSRETGTTRRSLLRRGLLLLGGAGAAGAGLAGAARVAERSPTASRRSATAIELYGDEWHMRAANRGHGHMPQRGELVSLYGNLRTGPHGEKVGEFYASSMFIDAPLGESPHAASNVETHTFNLKDGSIVGMGTASTRESLFAVVGGTGRYAGASGSYVSVQSPFEVGGDGTARFNLSLVL